MGDVRSYHELGGDDGLPAGWERCLRTVYDEHGERRFVPSRPIYFVMIALCFVNTFAGSFLVPHCKSLADFFHLGPDFAALIVCTPQISQIGAVYLSKYLVKKKGWLYAVLTNFFFMCLGTGICFCSLYFSIFTNPKLLLLGGLVTGMGTGQQFLGRQLGVETSSSTTRNKIFAHQTVATSMGILSGVGTSGMTSKLVNDHSAKTLALPFAILFSISLFLSLVVLAVMPNQIVKLPASEALSTTGKTDAKGGQEKMSDADKKVRIWSTVIIGFNRVVVRSVVENETTAFYQGICGYPESVSSMLLVGAYAVAIIAVQLFGCVHDRLDDRTWIYISLSLILFGTCVQFPLDPGNHSFERVVKFTIGVWCVLPGLAMNTAVANAQATKYAIPDHWLYNNEMISLIQIVTQQSLARIVGPFVGFALAMQDLRLTIVLQGCMTIMSLVLVFFGVGANPGETAKGRAAIRAANGQMNGTGRP